MNGHETTCLSTSLEAIVSSHLRVPNSGKPVTWFPNQLAYTNHVVRRDDYLSVADRNTRQMTQSLPIAGEPLALDTVRGMTVLLSTDSSGMYLTGFA